MTSQLVRLGGIDYLNALPLTRYIESGGVPALEISDHSPSRLAALLHKGELDIAVAPVVEYLRRPQYEVAPGICISSYGAVESIRLYFRRPLSETRAVGLDTSSRSSALLVRLLYRELWGGHPRFEQLDPQDACGVLAGGVDDPAETESVWDAILLIGDAALRQPEPTGWEVIDLGTEWSRWTGLPFVYAFWICREGVLSDALSARLCEAKRHGIAKIDEISRECGAARGISEVACRHYLRQTIQYDFGRSEQEGLRLFFSLLERNGLVATPLRPLVATP